MKNKFFYILFAAVIVFYTACSDDFLNTEPTGHLSSEQMNEIANNNPDDVLEPLVTGFYSTTFVQGTGGTTGHDDFGQKSVDICLDFMSGDFGATSMTYGWFGNVYNFTGQIRTDNRAYMNWRYYYRLIKAANEVFDFLGSDESLPENQAAREYYGQAKAIRAYCYFYLVNLYQHPYSDKKDAPGVPVYRSQLTPEVLAQSTVAEVYDRIITDLLDAIEALENFNRGADKSKMDKNVALAYLAYAYLMRGESGDYQLAADAAGEIISSNRFPLMTAHDVINSGFRDIAIPSWIWGIDLTIENTSQLASHWGHVDYFTYSYSWAGDIKVIDADFYASIPDTDVRKGQFGSPTTGVIGDAPLAPIWKFWHEGRAPAGDRAWTSDLVYMRVEEMYLIRAEAFARSGNLAAAKTTLKALVDLRDPVVAAEIDAMTEAELMEAIYFNWRVEMWGEGKTLFAVKRYKKTVTRANNHVRLPGSSFAYNYERMIFEIPENEQINNPYLLPQQ